MMLGNPAMKPGLLIETAIPSLAASRASSAFDWRCCAGATVHWVELPLFIIHRANRVTSSHRSQTWMSSIGKTIQYPTSTFIPWE